MSTVKFHSLVRQFNTSPGQASRKALRKTLNKTQKFRPHYWSFMRRIHWSQCRWPTESPPKGPAVRKALIMQFQGYRANFVSSIYIYIHIHIYMYTHTYIHIHHKHQWISLPLATLINRQYRKIWKKTTRLSTTDSLWGETTGDHCNLHPKGQQS